jgi:tagatose 1,6-diphosphate aldolase
MESTPGKWRRLHQAADPRGAFAILAIDHRGPLRRALAPPVGAGGADGALVELKIDIVRALAPACTAVLLDPETGVGPCVAAGALPGQTGLLVALDTGSTGDPAVLRTGLVEGWDAARAARIGAQGVKLLVYYHPEAPNAVEVEQLVSRIGRACDEVDLPFYLEPLSYDPAQPGRPLPPEERRRVVLASARRLVPLGVDVLKAEFPVDVAAQPDEAVWRGACAELSAVCAAPWVLLSAGVSFETFFRQAAVACAAGASGVMAGRAVWHEAVTADRAARTRFLRDVATERMARLAALCAERARPFARPPPDSTPL